MIGKSINTVVIMTDRRLNSGKLPKVDLQCLVGSKGREETELGRH